MNLPPDIAERFTQYVEQAALTSLMDEVSATPKPGLVDLNDSGAHTDMDYHTFSDSAKAIAPFIASMARAGGRIGQEKRLGRPTSSGCNATASDYTEEELLFLSIRPIGLEAEKAMFAATKGVNTHKGMIFSMGLTAAAAGVVFSKYQTPDVTITAENILSMCQKMCHRPLQADFASISPLHPKTHGERLFVEHGVRGIRGEAADGFPSIRDAALPILREELKKCGSGDRNRLCLQILLKLMSRVDDTNVLFRTDYESLLYAKKSAFHILSLGGSFTDSGMTALSKLNEDFIKRNISPGGCADLLAITLFLWRMEQYFTA